jgi:hypothetical protein
MNVVGPLAVGLHLAVQGLAFEEVSEAIGLVDAVLPDLAGFVASPLDYPVQVRVLGGVPLASWARVGSGFRS